MSSPTVIPFAGEIKDVEKQGVEELFTKLQADYKDYPWIYDQENLLRFLRDENGNVAKAYDRLVNTIKWRQANTVDTLTAEDVKEEISRGQIYLMPTKSKTGSAAIVGFAGLHEPGRPIEPQLKFFAYMIEKALATLPAGHSKKFILIFERIGSGWKNMDSKHAELTNVLLKTHYPGCIEWVVLLRVDWLFSLMWNVLKHFVDPKLMPLHKMISGEPKTGLLAIYDEDQLWDFWGGKNKWRPENPITSKFLNQTPVEPPKESEEEKKKIEAQVQEEMEKLKLSEKDASKSIGDLD